MNKKIKICHLSSVHPRFDVRIFYKECLLLNAKFGNVTLIVADGKGNETINSVNIFDVGKQSGRLKRIIFSPKNVYNKALEINADIYHFHDPELIPVGLKLIRKGKKVIYDVHEDLPKQLLTKPYLNLFLRKIIAFVFEKYEKRSARKLSAIVTATDFIKTRFDKFNSNVFAVKNYPKIEIDNQTNWSDRQNIASYIGLLSRERGIYEIVKASAQLNCKLHIAGEFINQEFKTEITNLPEWQNVVFHGYVGRDKIAELLSISKIGLVTLYATENYKDALPVKMFEYMFAGIPVISSDIELWNSIINTEKCGISVNPKNVDEIAKAINSIIADDSNASLMGQNGRKSIIEKYNWNIESEKLVNIYTEI